MFLFPFYFLIKVLYCLLLLNYKSLSSMCLGCFLSWTIEIALHISSWLWSDMYSSSCIKNTNWKGISVVQLSGYHNCIWLPLANVIEDRYARTSLNFHLPALLTLLGSWLGRSQIMITWLQNHCDGQNFKNEYHLFSTVATFNSC